MANMLDFEAFLASHGIEGLTGEDVLGALEEGIDARTSVVVPVTAGDLEYLRAHGGVDARAALDDWDPAAAAGRRALGYTREAGDLIADSVTVAQAARLLGVDRSRISRRLRDKTLYSFRIGDRIRIPLWQFTGDRLLPGLTEVVAALPRGFSPAAVAARMRSPWDELGGESIAGFLAAGGAPEIAAELVAAMGRW
ncbi:helix-turn-helix domain-containing protein [Tsukamurella soli]|uniref:DNA binding domain-containing protein, excisionase family n=1 Tax=Tsukamurella soli TaxID=644556 RepID=A0ABP8JQJ7_9ACTN